MRQSFGAASAFGVERLGWSGWGESVGLFTAVFFADEDGFQDAEEGISDGLEGGHNLWVCWVM